MPTYPQVSSVFPTAAQLRVWSIQTCCNIISKHIKLIDQLLEQNTLMQQDGLFAGDEVQMVSGDWSQSVSLKMQKIHDWQVKYLLLYGNQRSTLVKEIAHVHFTDLLGLYLQNNHIWSIEGVPSIHMPRLKTLYLNQNSIISVKMLRKALWVDLQNLDISQNYFGDGKLICEGCFPQLNELNLYYNWMHKEEKNKSAEPCTPAKIQTSSLVFLEIRNNCLSLSRYEEVFERRWTHVCIE